MTPMSITQPSTTREPSMRLEREEARVAAAHSAAAMSPPRIAVTRASVRAARRAAARPAPSGGPADLCYHPPSRPALTPCRVPSTIQQQ